MKYSNRRNYRDQSVEIVEEVVMVKKKKANKIKNIFNTIKNWFKKNK
jgi:hypothetical protein